MAYNKFIKATPGNVTNRHWDFAKKLLLIFLPAVMAGCFLFSNRGEVLFKKGRYTIAKKNLVSYYFASPDLYVKTENGEVKINLNPYSSKNKIAQEKITSVEINEITPDSIQIHFTAKDANADRIQSQFINLNVKAALDSIQSGK